MRAALDWSREGRRWPHGEHSRFVEAGGLRWHVQTWGEGPAVVLLHGSGGSSHSWAALAPRLAGAGLGLVVPDLPGHAFTGRPADRGMTLEGFTRGVEALLAALDRPIRAVVGHSAGAAVALEVARGLDPAPPVVGICPALVQGRDASSSVVARFLGPGFRSGFAARLAAGLVRHTRGLHAVLSSTGSRVPAPSERLYRLLAGTPEHVNATLTLFTLWDAGGVEAGLDSVEGPVLLLAGADDGWIPVADVEKAAARIPGARLTVLDGLGHLAHEEAPDLVTREVLAFLHRQVGGGTTG